MGVLEGKLSDLPTKPGVYYHLDGRKRIIYVGKAANLKARVRQYFQPAAVNRADIRGHNLRAGIRDIQWTVTANPLQALFLESEMIKRYQPKYNFLERNVLGESWIYVLVILKGDNPGLRLTRELSGSEEGEILGPYLDGRALRKALRYLRRSFPYSTHKAVPRSPCLDYHIGLCPGPETPDFDAAAARTDLKRLAACLKGRQSQLLVRLGREMVQLAQKRSYEEAAKTRDQIQALENFRSSLVFRDLDRLPASGQDRALNDLRQLFSLKAFPQRVEAYDISHTGGSHVTASMVVAVGGLLRPAEGRRFKAEHSANDDAGQIRAVMRRRFKSRSLTDRPDLILIDGGRGQVGAVLAVLDELKLSIPVLGLAKKREEVIFAPQRLFLNAAKLGRLGGELKEGKNFAALSLGLNTDVVKFLQRLRDASHRSALSYHSYLRSKASTSSPLLALAGIGPRTYKKLLNRFGSLAGIRRAAPDELANVLNRDQLRSLNRYLQEEKK